MLCFSINFFRTITLRSSAKNIIINCFIGLLLSPVFSGISFGQPDNFSSILNRIHSLNQKGEKITAVYPDSALLFFNNGISLIKESEPKITDAELLKKFQLAKADIMSKAGLILQKQNKFYLASDYYNQALAAAKKTGDDPVTALCEFNIAEINLENGKYTKALSAYSNSLTLYQKCNDQVSVCWCYIGIAIVYRRCGNTEQSKYHYDKALEIAEEKNDDYLKGVIYNNLGNLYSQTGDFKMAINSLMTSLEYITRIGEEQNISDCYTSIGEFFVKYKDYQKAHTYFTKAMTIAENINDNYRLLACYANLSKTSITLDNKDNALTYINKTLRLINSTGDKSRLGEILTIISEYFAKNKDFNNTQLYLNQALLAANEIGDTVSIALSKEALARVFFENGQSGKALMLAREVQAVSSLKNISETYLQSSLLISKILEKQGDYRGAYLNFLKYTGIKDTLLNAERIKIIEDTEAKYNFTKLQNEKLLASNAALLAENKVQKRNIYLIILGIILFVISIFLVRIYLRKKKEAELHAGTQLRLSGEIVSLQSQLDTKNRELTSKAMLLSQNNKVFEEISDAIGNCFNGGENEKNELRKLKAQLENSYQEKGWDDFLKHFEQVHPDFYKNLTSKFPELSAGELKICAFLKMNLNTKEISQITNQTTKSIEVARTRIRKKLNIGHNENLYSAIQNI